MKKLLKGRKLDLIILLLYRIKDLIVSDYYINQLVFTLD